MTRIEKMITINGTEVKMICGNPNGKSVFKWNGFRNRFYITITINGVSKRFPFYDSIARHPQACTEGILEDCLDCCLNDAYIYENVSSLDEFMNEFGYESIKDAKQAYNGCEKAYKFFREANFDIYKGMMHYM